MDAMPLDLRPEILKLPPYIPGKPIEELRRENGLDHIIKLASNENPLGPPPGLTQHLVAALQTAHLYPDASHREARQAISKYHQIPVENVSLGDGSDAVITNISLCMLEPGDNVVSTTPTFPRYGVTARIAGAESRAATIHPDGYIPVQAIIDLIDKSTKIVWIANPNNPTGVLIPQADIEKIIEAMPPGALFVHDEAYYDFACHEPTYPKTQVWIEEGANVAALRTLSKSHGIAGIRAGYVLGPTDLISALECMREPFSVSSLALAAVPFALEECRDHMLATLDNNKTQMARLTHSLNFLGIGFLKSHANFVLVDFGDKADSVHAYLLASGIITRPGKGFGWPGHIRISIGTEQETDLLLDVLPQALEFEPE